MTNALVQQNVENIDTALLDALMQAKTTSNAQTKESNNAEFSNFMSSLDARVKKAQNNFDQKAKVTNTSSINKKALEKPVQKEVASNNSVKKQDSIASKEQRVVNNSEPLNKKETTKKIEPEVKKPLNAASSAESKVGKQEVKIYDTEAKTADIEENSSDINNSLLVESSPVSIQKEQEVVSEVEIPQQEITLEQEVILEGVVSSDILKNTIKTQDIEETIEDVLSKIENIEDVNKVIEEIASIFANLNQNNNQNNEQNNELTSALDEIKTLLEENKIEVGKIENFDNIISKLKEQLSSLTSKTDNNISNEVFNSVLNETINTNQITDLVQENLSQIQIADDKLQEIDKLTADVISEIKELTDALKNGDFKELDNVKEKLSQLLNSASKDIKALELNQGLQIKEIDKLNAALNELKDAIVEVSADDILKADVAKLENIVNKLDLNANENQIITADFSKNSIQTEDNDVKIEEFVSANKEIKEFIDIDTNKIDFSSKTSMNDILKVIEDFSEKLNLDFEELNLDEEMVKEINQKVEDLIDAMATVEISADDIKQAIDDIQQDAKNIFQNLKADSKNVLDISAKFSADFNSQEDANSQTFAQNQNKDNLNQDVDIEIASDFDFNQEIGTKNKVELNNVKPQENLSKAAFKDNILKDMLNAGVDDVTIEVDIKTIPTQSGALSAQDEIAKLALGEQNSLSPITSAHGSVTYDSTGVNAVIKNAAQLMKSAQPQDIQNPSMEEVLNQVSNKISQLKDTNTQKLTMVLRPNDLGRLSIELTSNAQGLTTVIMAQNEDIRAYIEKNIDSLRQQLADAGVNVNSIQIKTSGQEGSTMYEGNQNFKQEQDLANQDNKNGSQNQQNQNKKHDNKDAQSVLASMSDYDMHFAKDFSSILNKSLNYGN